jgi:hypothetical protein
MKKMFALAAVLALFSAQAFAASFTIGAGSSASSGSQTTGGSAALSAQVGGGVGVAVAHNDTTNTGAAAANSTTGFLTTNSAAASGNQTTSNSVGFHAQTGGIGAATGFGVGNGASQAAANSGFNLTLP